MSSINMVILVPHMGVDSYPRLLKNYNIKPCSDLNINVAMLVYNVLLESYKCLMAQLQCGVAIGVEDWYKPVT